DDAPHELRRRRAVFRGVAAHVLPRASVRARSLRKGLADYTTLDLDMQEAAEQSLQSQLNEIESGVYSNGKFEGTSYRDYMEKGRATPDDQGPFAPYLQGALLALDVRTGNILAMVGGRDFVDSKWN